MLYIALCNVRSENADSTMRKRVERRMQWSPPPGLTVRAEYWLQTPHPQVIMVTEAEAPAAIMAAVAAWDDVFDITIVPAFTADEGMKAAAALAGAGG